MNEQNVEIEAPVKSHRRRIAKKRWRDRHPEEIAAYDASYYDKNRDRIRESKKCNYLRRCEEIKAKRRDRFAKEQQRKIERAKRADYLWRHPEVTRKSYDGAMRRRKRFEVQKSPEWSAGERRRNARRRRAQELRHQSYMYAVEHGMPTAEAAIQFGYGGHTRA